MTREQKIAKRKAARNAKYREFLDENQSKIRAGGFTAAKNGSWYDSERGCYMQVCSYDAYGICESPCNGDC